MDEFVSKKLLVAKFNELASKYIDGDKRQRGLAYITAADMIALADAADVQPVKRGRWVQYNRNGEETYIECTNCCVPSRPRHLQMVTRTGEGLPDYCPNCGADMREFNE